MKINRNLVLQIENAAESFSRKIFNIFVPNFHFGASSPAIDKQLTKHFNGNNEGNDLTIKRTKRMTNGGTASRSLILWRNNKNGSMLWLWLAIRQQTPNVGLCRNEHYAQIQC
uniref:Uncharacterized protein n=1 Tax=Glossina austeni TaxID=7395 RepID=A0A1A9VHZ1_GLOAU